MPDSSSGLLLRDHAVPPEENTPFRRVANGAPRQRAWTVFQRLVTLLACLAVLAVIVPFNPLMPSRLLETPWMMAMNQGVAQDLQFGRDIVFTFGPYASVYTELYNPATDGLMMFGCLLLGFSYVYALLVLGKGQKPYWLLLYAVFLCCLLDSRDALLFSYPLVLSLTVYRLTLPDDHALHLDLGNTAKCGCALLFTPLGLLPLIKGSLLPICGFVAVSCFAVLWLRRQRALAIASLSVPTVVCVVLWRLSGQPVEALSEFFWTMREIISGYSEAMSLAGDPWQWVLYLVASALIISATARIPIAGASLGRRPSRFLLVSAYSVYLFLAFKACFVRHDLWHDPIGGSSILAAALLLIFVSGQRRSLIPLAASILAFAYIGHGPVKTTREDVSQNLRKSLGRAARGIWTRLGKGESLRAQYVEHLAAVRAEFPLLLMNGTTDIYSFNQSWLFASGNLWAPRPVIQSYSAYTADLAQRNLRHLLGAEAPDNIVFRVEPIDGRLPSLEDGLSWPALIGGYSLQTLDGQTAYFHRRKPGIQADPEIEEQLPEARHQFGEVVDLPETDKPLFATVEITPTLLGSALNMLYKPPELHVEVRLRSGKTASYRVVPGMMKTNFLISPLVATTEDFALLAAGGNYYLAGSEVKSLILSSGDPRELFWNPSYSLSLRTLRLSNSNRDENSLLFGRLEDAMPKSVEAPSSAVCEGMIETVNGTSPRFGTPAIDNVLSVRGWTVISGVDGTVPESVFVTLTSPEGKTLYVQAKRERRNDIRAHFKRPGMPDPGYSSIADVSSLTGSFKLGLARVYQGNLEICKQFQIPVSINH